MGCTQSRIENEEAVTQCKERKQFIKDAARARNSFAASHSAYAMSLKNTGAALSDYSHGEVQNPQLVTAASHQSAAAQPPLDPLPPPPPPPLNTPPIQRAASTPEIINTQKARENGVGPTTVEENYGDDEDEIEINEKLITRRRSSGRNKSRHHQQEAVDPPQQRAPPPAVEDIGSMPAVQEWEYSFPPEHSTPGPSLEVKAEEKENVESKTFDEIPKREENLEEKPKEVPSPPPRLPVVEVADEEIVMAAVASGGGSVKRGKSAAGMGEKRPVKASTNLLQVFVDLDDDFLKASESAREVSKMLEATRLHYHSNFADNRGNSLV